MYVSVTSSFLILIRNTRKKWVQKGRDLHLILTNYVSMQYKRNIKTVRATNSSVSLVFLNISPVYRYFMILQFF